MTAAAENTRKLVLYMIVCGSPVARTAGDGVTFALADGWDVCVVTSPDGLKWIDVPTIARLTGHPVRHQYKYPGDLDVLPAADAILVAPATVNTINKWAAGIADTLALGMIVEAVGNGLPIVAMPFTNEAMARHPAFPRSVDALREWGVTVLFDLPPFAPGAGESFVDEFPWRLAVDAVKQRAWRSASADHW
jgi:hypothetical protein